MDTAWVEQAGGAAHFHAALVGFLIFRILIAVLQSRDELTAWFRLRHAAGTRRLRSARL